MLCKGDPGFRCTCPTTLENLRLWAHKRTLGVPRNVDDLETIEFADLLRNGNECTTKPKHVAKNSSVQAWWVQNHPGKMARR